MIIIIIIIIIIKLVGFEKAFLDKKKERKEHFVGRRGN